MECGTCTACCSLYPIDEIGKPMNTDCQYCTGGGCSVHSTKPEMCKTFECAYYQGKNVPESLRPDKCGVIFTMNSDRIFTGHIIPETDITDIAKEQVNSFQKQGYSVVLLSLDANVPRIMPSENHNPDEIYKEYMEILDKWRHTAQI